MSKLILASTSPRRQQLLNNLGMHFEIIPPASGAEIEFTGGDPVTYAITLACNKANQVADVAVNRLVLAADTIVVKDGDILGKPESKQAAKEMLELLSGSVHQVITGLCLKKGDDSITSFEKTIVHFRELTADEIERYVDTGEPMDKAGGYGIQGKGALLVSYIEGCYYNVVGLPLTRLASMLKEFGITIL
ncbi:MAG: Maf family protein [Chitinophagales bacterium]